MGCDGGTIPTRDEMIRVKKKPEKKDKDADRDAKWKNCNLSQSPLQSPIVACDIGHLYNKESVIEFLLDRTKYTNADHIRGLKDVKELNLTLNRAIPKKTPHEGDRYIDMSTSRYVCPVTGLEMSGQYKFVYLFKCGCVFAQRAFNEVKVSNCFKCAIPFTAGDIVIINGNEEDENDNESNMHVRRLNAKLNKKEKKKHKLEATSDSVISKSSKRSKNDTPSNKLAEGLESQLPTASKIVSDLIPKTTKCIQNDPNTSSTYKSLFTTSFKAKKSTARQLGYIQSLL